MHETSIEQQKRILRRRRKLMENLTGYLFVMPNLLGFIVFTVFSIIFSFYMSFTDWSLIKLFQNIKFVGIENYLELFTDKWFQASVMNNLWFLLTVPVTIFFAMVIAFISTTKSLQECIPDDHVLTERNHVVAISVIWLLSSIPVRSDKPNAQIHWQ